MRGIPSLITDIRKNVFTEVARMAYAGGDYTNAEDLPYKIVPGDQPRRAGAACYGPGHPAYPDPEPDD